MTAPNISIEDRKIFCDLAVAVADALSSAACPRDLAERLLELADPLFELLTLVTPYALTVVQLRALAGLPESGHRMPCPEPEKAILDAQDAVLGESDAGSQALAMTN